MFQPTDPLPIDEALPGLLNALETGNMAVLVNTPRAGLRTLDDVIEAAATPSGA